VSGTFAITAKRAVVTAAAAALPDVQVAYSWPGERAQRECVYGGDVEFTQAPMTFSGGGRTVRREVALVEIHVAVRKPGADNEETEARAAEIGEHLEDALAADPTLSGQALAFTINDGDLVSGFNDEDSITVLSYEVRVESKLT
jgi:hypothetical protein